MIADNDCHLQLGVVNCLFAAAAAAAVAKLVTFNNDRLPCQQLLKLLHACNSSDHRTYRSQPVDISGRSECLGEGAASFLLNS